MVVLSRGLSQLCFYRLSPFAPSKLAGCEEVLPRLLYHCPVSPDHKCLRNRFCESDGGALFGADSPSLQKLDLGLGCASIIPVTLHSLQLRHNFHCGLRDCKVDRVPVGLDVVVCERALEDVIDVL